MWFIIKSGNSATDSLPALVTLHPRISNQPLAAAITLPCLQPLHDSLLNTAPISVAPTTPIKETTPTDVTEADNNRNNHDH